MYFRNFYAFRFIAAMAVVVLHIELMARRFGWASGPLPNPVVALSLGVDFFFVLSGFLITSLLLKDQRGGSLQLRRFYIRRALRILPLYYLVVFAVFGIVPLLGFPKLPGMPLQADFSTQLLLHLLVLPQVAKSFLNFVPYGGQLWTIGVEAMFYLFWPLLIAMRPKLSTAVALIVSMVALKGAALLAFGGSHPISAFLAMSRIEVMAMGGAAFFVFSALCGARQGTQGVGRFDLLINWAFGSRQLCIGILILLAGLTAASWVWLDDAVHLVAGLLFSALLIYSCLGYMDSTLLENRVIVFLGEVSYGIYLWHFIAAGAMYKLIEWTQQSPGDWSFWPTVYGGTIVLTLVASALSFLLVEKPVNALRHRF